MKSTSCAGPSNPLHEHQAHHRIARAWQAAWASIVLIVYCTSDARGRPLLRAVGNLTDLDVQTACTLEAYGRGEVTRRARLRAGQEAEEAKKQSVAKRGKQARKPEPRRPSPQVADASMANTEVAGAVADMDASDPNIDLATGLPIEDDTASIVNDDDDEDDDDDPLSTESADQKVLATKRKRASKGYASASTSDSHGVLSW
jgi:hypothetical protein